MDKPELPIQVKVVQHSFSATDANGQVLTAACERTHTLEEQPFRIKVNFELIRPESPTRSRLGLTHVFSRADAGLVLAAAERILTLLQLRESRHERAPRNGIEFSVDVLPNLKVGAVEAHGKDPAFFIALSTASESLRFQFEKLNEWDAFKQVFQYAG